MNKKITNSQKRIVEILDYFGISQTELCKRTGIQKSALDFLNSVFSRFARGYVYYLWYNG